MARWQGCVARADLVRCFWVWNVAVPRFNRRYRVDWEIVWVSSVRLHSERGIHEAGEDRDRSTEDGTVPARMMDALLDGHKSDR